MGNKLNFAFRPKCVQCDNDAQFIGSYKKDDSPKFRKYCVKCHYERQAEKKGLTANEWANSFHPYKKYRKSYCENAKGENAGWLGFVCTTRIVFPHLQLDTDHIDGDPTNHDEDNMMTLCKCCHSIKSNFCGDYATPGRKSLKVRNV